MERQVDLIMLNNAPIEFIQALAEEQPSVECDACRGRSLHCDTCKSLGFIYVIIPT